MAQVNENVCAFNICSYVRMYVLYNMYRTLDLTRTFYIEKSKIVQLNNSLCAQS